MARRSILDVDRFYERAAASCSPTDPRASPMRAGQPTAAAGKLLAQLPLAKIAKAKAAKNTDGFEETDYIHDRIDAGKSLSNYYTLTQSRSVAKHAASYQPFKKTQSGT